MIVHSVEDPLKRGVDYDDDVILFVKSVRSVGVELSISVALTYLFLMDTPNKVIGTIRGLYLL